MYPPTCPPTRMLRQHVSQECTSASYRIPPSSSRLICPPSSLSHAPQLKLALLLLLCTRPKHVFARHSHRQPKQVTHIYSPKHTRLVSPPPQAIQPRFPTKGKGPSKGVVNSITQTIPIAIQRYLYPLTSRHQTSSINHLRASQSNAPYIH